MHRVESTSGFPLRERFGAVLVGPDQVALDEAVARERREADAERVARHHVALAGLSTADLLEARAHGVAAAPQQQYPEARIAGRVRRRVGDRLAGEVRADEVPLHDAVVRAGTEEQDAVLGAVGDHVTVARRT